MRASNYPAGNLEKFQLKVERQIGGSIDDNQSKLLLLIYKKVCNLSTAVQELQGKECCCVRGAATSADETVVQMKSEDDYHHFVGKLTSAEFRENVVSSLSMIDTNAFKLHRLIHRSLH